MKRLVFVLAGVAAVVTSVCMFFSLVEDMPHFSPSRFWLMAVLFVGGFVWAVWAAVLMGRPAPSA